VRKAVAAVLVAFLGLACHADSGNALIAVPYGATVTVDGTMEESEWEAESSFAASAQCTHYVVHDGTFLYLGIRSGGRGFGSPCLVQSGSVSVLHASAALATASYGRDGDQWVLTQGFASWECRDEGLTRMELVPVRDAFLSEHGWIASTGGMGNHNEVEYAIRLQGEDLRMQLLFYDTGSFPRMVSWPHLEGDLQAYRQLLDGNLPVRMSFETRRWMTIRTDTP